MIEGKVSEITQKYEVLQKNDAKALAEADDAK